VSLFKNAARLNIATRRGTLRIIGTLLDKLARIVLRSFFSRLFSGVFLAGVLTGLMMGMGGLVLYAQVRVQMAASGSPNQKRYLEPISLSDSVAAAVRDTVPGSWKLRPPEGPTMTFSDLQDRPILLVVGATWCKPCMDQMPTLQVLHDTTGRNVRVAFVSTEPRDSLRERVGGDRYSLPVFVAEDLPRPLTGELLPRTYLIRPDGAIVYRHVGPADWGASATHRLLDRALASAEGSPGERFRYAVTWFKEP
jgi:thiol-disulfide isomerase/thioredoxin